MASAVIEDADAAELARLDEVIAESDADDGLDDRWRAADAVYDKARLIERREGPDAALALYEDVVGRLTGCRESGPRDLLIGAMNDIAVIHHKQGRYAQSRSAADAAVRDHFDDAPPESTYVLVNATLLLAWLLCEAGKCDQALELLERLIERYGQPGVSRYEFTAAVANAEAAWTLGEMGRFDEGILRCRDVIRDLGDPVDPELRKVLLDALVKHANLFTDKNLPLRRNEVCEQIVERFAGSDDPQIVENVTWAQMVLDEYPVRRRRRGLRGEAVTASPPSGTPDGVAGCRTPEDWFALGCRSHRRVGRAADAEAAYVKAIEGGRFDAWLNLGILFSSIPGRLADEESALRKAMDSDDPEIASWAALRLGLVLDRLHGDLDGARPYFELAAERGRGVTAHHATINLGLLAAYQGDRLAAREALTTAMIAIGDARGLDMENWARRVAPLWASEAATWPTRRLWRMYHQAGYRTRRRFQALRISSLPARWFAQIWMRIRGAGREGTKV